MFTVYRTSRSTGHKTKVYSLSDEILAVKKLQELQTADPHGQYSITYTPTT